MKKITLGLLSIFTASSLFAGTYSVDTSHSTAGFSVKHMMVTNVHGKFTSYDAKVEFDDATKTFKKLVANIDTNSIDTGIEKRDNHLRSDDFFAVEKFPKMTFEMTSY